MILTGAAFVFPLPLYLSGPHYLPTLLLLAELLPASKLIPLSVHKPFTKATLPASCHSLQNFVLPSASEKASCCPRSSLPPGFLTFRFRFQ
jgi:hypothetical protein